jgi:hypothetical protein
VTLTVVEGLREIERRAKRSVPRELRGKVRFDPGPHPPGRREGAVTAPAGGGAALKQVFDRPRALVDVGTSEIIHTANRGENLTVIFVNNTTYGMTGGQMAPTTMPGQRTTTSPQGRAAANDGHPMRMAELLAGLPGTAYAARVATSSPAQIKKAKQAVTRAFEMQLQGLGLSIVEFLSTCPTNWGMKPLEAQQRVLGEMSSYFPTRRSARRWWAHPASLLVMNGPSLDKYRPLARPGATLVLNASLVDPARVERQDLRLLAVPANELGGDLGSLQLASMVALGAYAAATGVLRVESLGRCLPRVVSRRHQHLIPSNARALQAGAALAAPGPQAARASRS